MAWWSSLMGGGGSSGGGDSGGGMGQMGGMMNAAGKANDAIMQAIEEPYAIRRSRIMEVAPQVLGVGSSIGPVAQTPGGSQMANSMMQERAGASQAFGTERTSALDQRMRNLYATEQVARNSAKIVRKIASMIAGGAAGGAAAGGASSGAEGGMSVAGGEGGAMSAAPPAGYEAASSAPAASSGSWLTNAMDLYDRYNRYMPSGDSGQRRPLRYY